MRKCKICQEEITAQNMSRHVNSVHLKKKRFKCANCSKRYTTKKNMKSHEEQCDGDENEKC